MKTSVEHILNCVFNPKSYFILEVAAIPFIQRYEYLNKLLERRDSGNQKNVQILKYIYECIDGSSPDNWNEQEVSRKFKISLRMLDCHKSRLLKGLREFYFNWDEIETRIRNTFKAESEIIVQYELAKEQIKVGMFREAKNILIALEKIVSLKNFPSIVIMDLYGYLLTYYFSIRDVRKYNLYHAKFIKFFSSRVKSKISKEELLKLEVRLTLAKYTELQFKHLTDSRLNKSNEYLEYILKIIDKNNDSNLYLKVIHLYGYFLKRFQNSDDAIRLCEKGIVFAKRRNLFDEYCNLKAAVVILKFLSDSNKADEAYMEIQRIFNETINRKIDFSILIFIQSLHLRMLIYKNKETDIPTEDFVYNLILFSKRAEAATRWYLEISDRYSSLIYIWKVKQTRQGKIQYDIELDKELLKQFEIVNYKSLIHFNQIDTPETLVVVYLNQIELEFWKGLNCNFENAHYYIKKTERLLNTKHVRTNKVWLLSSKIGVKIFEDLKFMHLEKVYEKNISGIIELINALKSKYYVFNISGELGKLIYIDKVTGNKKFTKHIIDFQDWLWENKPDMMSSIMNFLNKSTDVA